jgi:hypothetical protein
MQLNRDGGSTYLHDTYVCLLLLHVYFYILLCPAGRGEVMGAHMQPYLCICGNKCNLSKFTTNGLILRLLVQSSTDSVSD